jgi:hypothetical protein
MQVCREVSNGWFRELAFLLHEQSWIGIGLPYGL